MNSLIRKVTHFPEVESSQYKMCMQTDEFLKCCTSVTHQEGLAGDSPTSLLTKGFEVPLSGEAPERFLSETPVWNQIHFYFPASLRLQSKDIGQTRCTAACPMKEKTLFHTSNIFFFFFIFLFASLRQSSHRSRVRAMISFTCFILSLYRSFSAPVVTVRNITY